MFLNQKINVEGGNQLVGVGADGKTLADGQLAASGIPPNFFSDIHVRNGFNYCFDRDTYIAQVTHGEAIPHRGPIISGLPGYDEKSTIFTYDVAKCKAELDQAWGGKLKDSGFALTLAYNSGNDNRRISLELLRDGLEKAYGGSKGKMTLSIISMAWPAYLDARAKGRLPVNVTGWLEDFHDSWDWIHPYMSCNGDFSGQQGIDPKICGAWDELMVKALTSTDPAESAKIYTQLQKEANDQAIDIFIDQATVREYDQMWVQGWYYMPLFTTPYWAAMSKVAP
jgi:peptide/nickel transport system substrate-binding protein